MRVLRRAHPLRHCTSAKPMEALESPLALEVHHKGGAGGACFRAPRGPSSRRQLRCRLLRCLQLAARWHHEPSLFPAPISAAWAPLCCREARLPQPPAGSRGHAHMMEACRPHAAAAFGRHMAQAIGY